MKTLLILALTLSLTGCAVLGNAPSKGLAEATFSLSNGWTIGVEAFTHPTEQSTDCDTASGTHPSPGVLNQDKATSMKADQCAQARFTVAAGYLETATLSGLNCRFGNSPYQCGAQLVDTDTGEVLANTGMRSEPNWYSAPPQMFGIHKPTSGHLTVLVRQIAEGRADYAHQDYPVGNGTATAILSAPDGTTISLRSTLTHPGPDDSGPGIARHSIHHGSTWKATVTTKQNAVLPVSVGARSWPTITLKVSSFDANPYEIGVFVVDAKTHNILGFVNYKATGTANWQPATFSLTSPTSGELYLSIFMWEVHSANWLNPPLSGELQ